MADPRFLQDGFDKRLSRRGLAVRDYLNGERP